MDNEVCNGQLDELENRFEGQNLPSVLIVERLLLIQEQAVMESPIAATTATRCSQADRAGLQLWLNQERIFLEQSLMPAVRNELWIGTLYLQCDSATITEQLQPSSSYEMAGF